MGIKDERKFENLHKLVHILLDHPEGLTKSEIARRLGVHRSTAAEYIDSLEGINAPVFEVSPNHFTIDRDQYQVQISVDIHESLALHLAARLLTTRTDKHYPHAASALRKLGVALKKLAPLASEHIKHSADVLDGEQRRKDSAFLEVLETLTRAWSRGLKVEITHEMGDGQTFAYTLSPYFIEPYAIGRTMHVIGLREPPGEIRTLKIERIRTAKLSDEVSEIPNSFDSRAYLQDAWGIWIGGNELQEVALRFSPKVAKRVQETQWHYSQEMEEQNDGWLLWKAQVGEWKEMLPWIRGWGADCEVVGPDGLRKRLAKEAKRLARVYGVVTTGDNTETMFFAHTKDDADEAEWQLLKDHLIATGDLAATLGKPAGISELARVAGILHDIGKYSKEFQARLRGSKKRVDHATAGAREIMHLFPDLPERDFAELISYCIAGHHTGLPDYGSKADVETDGTLLARREKKKIKNYDAYRTEIKTELLALKPQKIHPARFRMDGKESVHTGFSVSFLTRMLFSTLTDADWLDTERFVQGDTKRGQHASIKALNEQFTCFLQKFANPTGEINKKRTETLNACVDKAKSEPGFFTLTVPTGGGKTYSSMAFALNHALEHGLRRVIYVIPFTSIIEQNAAVFRDALGALGPDNVLEHHSNFDWEGKPQENDDETNKASAKMKLDAENWDVPIVVTTNVQFFESLFASKKRSARKLHNIAKSVIIFDEAQMLPREYLKPSLLAVQELVNNYGATAVFCTATQPSLPRFFSEKIQFIELAPDTQELFDFYKRVDVRNLGTQTDEDLLEKINAHPQALCIVNTRKHARGLFAELDEGDGFHLSTLMCPIHRKQTMEKIHQRLSDGQPCRVVSTQVMEAGIDVDFPVGYRALAGLDSIIQAAGRVNREAKQASGDMFVFSPKTEFIKRTPKFIEQTSAVAESTLRDFGDDPTSIAAIEAYYEMLYTLQSGESFDAKNILDYFERGGETEFRFKAAAENFKLITNSTVAVIIPFEHEVQKLIEELVERLKFSKYLVSTVRKLQPYTVNIYEGEFMNLQSKGVIYTIGEHYHVLDANRMSEYYHPKTGLYLPEGGSGEAIFFDG